MNAAPQLRWLDQASMSVARWVVGVWERLGALPYPRLTIVLAWAVMVLPLVFWRGFNSDEGLAVSLARTALEDGQWMVPHLFNVRWVERPTLLSWVIAALSWPFGWVDQVTARTPIVLSVLAGALLVYAFVRQVARPAAAFVGAALFLSCPIVIRGFVMTTADLPLAVVLFAALLVWWQGEARGQVSWRRWLAIGAILACAGLLKGPQPLGYFFLGVGLYQLLTRSFRSMPGLVFAGVVSALPLFAWYGFVIDDGDAENWARFMRLGSSLSAPLPGPAMAFVQTVFDTLPAIVAAAAFLLLRWRDTAPAEAPPRLITALLCYTLTCSALILFWPGGATPRYFFPAVPALCVLGALGFAAFAERRPRAVAPALLIAGSLLTYSVVYAMASPLLPRAFRSTALDGARISDVVTREPAVIYRVNTAALNTMPYVRGRIRDISLGEATELRAPAYLVVTREDAATIAARQPGRFTLVLVFGNREEWQLLRAN
jgi:4-amino-4-deoxy-L-arabinose transferase-like glycosyltransferase